MFETTNPRMKLFLIPYLLSLALAADQLIDPTSKDNSPQCQCYLASGPDPGYFQYHRFWDFRNIANDGDNTYTQAPPLINNLDDYGHEAITSPYFNTSTFLADWDIQTGQVAHDTILPTYNSAQNIYISRNSTSGTSSTYLTLRAHRLATFVSIAELDSNQKNLLHSSIRLRARIIPNGLSNSSAPSSGLTPLLNTLSGSNTSHPVDGGAVFGAFTYHDDSQESDIEILTADPTSQIHYSNQPDFDYKTNDPVPGASTQDTLPNGLVWTDWLDHRIDWFQGVSRWYVNGELVQNKTKNAPVDHSGFILNLWSDGGNWSGNMSVGAQVTVGIEWVQMVFNISGNVDGTGKRKRSGEEEQSSGLCKRKSGSASCQVACRVDGVQNVGFPEVVYNVTSLATSHLKQGSSGMLAAFIVTSLLSLLVTFG